MKRLALKLALAAFSSIGVRAFYLPGAAPHNYQDGERVEVFVNALTPMIGATVDGKLVCGRCLLITLRSNSYLARNP